MSAVKHLKGREDPFREYLHLMIGQGQVSKIICIDAVHAVEVVGGVCSNPTEDSAIDVCDGCVVVEHRM